MEGIEETEEKVSPFVWVDHLSQGLKEDLIEVHGEAAYPAFLINRAFSQYPDTIAFAAEINQYPAIPGRMAYDYYLHGTRNKKRWAKWGKKKGGDHLALVMAHYDVRREVAQQYLSVLTDGQIQAIKKAEEEKASSE